MCIYGKSSHKNKSFCKYRYLKILLIGTLSHLCFYTGLFKYVPRYIYPTTTTTKKLIKYSYIKYYCDVKDELLAKKKRKSKAVSQTSNKNIAVMFQMVCSAGPPQWTLLSQFLFTLCRL